MWRNYVTVGLRSLIRSKTYAFINIFGLATGLAACLMLLLYVRYERSYDEWLPNADRLYQVQTFYAPDDNGPGLQTQMAAYVSGQALERDFPQIERRVYMLSGAPTVVKDGEAFDIEDARMVDGPFFDMFEIPFVHGDRESALAEVGTVALSRTEAERLFGPRNPVGETLSLVLDGETVDHRVTGVFEDLPKNSHLAFTMLVRFDPNSYFADSPSFMTNFGWQAGWVYVQLRDGADPQAIHAQMPAWERRNIPDEDYGGSRYNAGDQQDYRLVPLADVHLGPAQNGAMTPGNDAQSIVTFAIIALLILGMACVNFTNLATARASQRAREVALRKVLGASRRQLVVQFIGESVILVTVSMVIALALVELLLPSLSAFLGANLTISYFGEGGIILPVLLLVLVVGAVGGLYPAFYLSRYQPAQVLKANKSTAEPAGSGRLRSMLVVAQFAVSIGLIICTAVVYAQTVFARNADPGFDRDRLIQLSNLGAESLAGTREALVREVRRIDGVEAAARTGIGISTPNTITNGVVLPGQSEQIEIGSYAVDPDFFDAMGVDLVAGRGFDANRPGDDATVDPDDVPGSIRANVARGVNIVVNELAARRLGFADPREAVGRQLRASLYDSEYGLVPITIIGVVRDSRFRDVRSPIEPIMFRQSRGALNWMVVRYAPDADPAAVRERIRGLWQRFATDVPFDADYSADIVAELYEAEEARAKTFAGFSLLAVAIACLGLFGLAAFTAERRTKEIGIRKVFGARSRDIVGLLAWQFSKPVIVANIIAWPVAWWVMRDWLNGFDAQVDLGPTPFLLAGFVALAIAVGTISGHALRVARSNPVNALRYE